MSEKYYQCVDCEMLSKRASPDTPWECFMCRSVKYYLRPLDGRDDLKAKPDSAARKGQPLFSGCLMYFPDALLAVSEHSRKGNDKHNPGKPLHWSKDKSTDHADCIARHLTDIGPTWDSKDPEFDSLHATALAWRALALLQTVLERKKGSQ